MKPAEAIDKVDVQARANRARERTNGNGRMQEVAHFPQDIPQESDRLWERLKRIFPQPEALMVAGKQVSGFVVPHWAAGVLLAAILGCVGFMYSQINSQRDMLIRLDIQLQERDKHEMEYRSEFKNQLNVQKVYIDDMRSQMIMVKTFLTPQQIRSLNSRKVEQ